MSERDLVSFTVDGKPQGKQRPRFVRGRCFTPIATRRFERQVGWACAIEHTKRRMGGMPFCPVALTVACYFPDARRRDADNVLKAVMDGLNGVAYDDDSRVVSATVTKDIDRERPRTEVTVRYLR